MGEGDAAGVFGSRSCVLVRVVAATNESSAARVHAKPRANPDVSSSTFTLLLHLRLVSIELKLSHR